MSLYASWALIALQVICIGVNILVLLILLSQKVRHMKLNNRPYGLNDEGIQMEEPKDDRDVHRRPDRRSTNRNSMMPDNYTLRGKLADLWKGPEGSEALSQKLKVCSNASDLVLILLQRLSTRDLSVAKVG